MFHVKHFGGPTSFADAKPPEQSIEHIFGGRAPYQTIESYSCATQLFCNQQGIGQELRCAQRLGGFCDTCMLPRIERRLPGFGQLQPRKFDKP